VPDLLTTLIAELERPREVSPQVVNHLLETYDLDRDGIGAFLVSELPKLEDYEIDLILSPLFTPTLKDQAIFAELLGKDSVPSSQWPVLIEQIVSRPTQPQLITSDGARHAVPLREVTVARYVNRLRLDATIPDALLRLLSEFPPVNDRPLLKAVARRAVWENEPRRRIFVRYFMAVASGEGYRADDTVGLLKLVETYEPADLNDLLARIPHWQRVLQQEINTGAGTTKPFFNERVEELHGGGRDQRRQDNSRLKAKEEEQAFLERLQGLLKG
jgi:hypothetical protein